MTKASKLQKVAVDSVAASYWEEYYKESGYGKEWTKKIPMRIKAALEKAENTPKTASKPLDPTIKPLATVITDSGVSLEGLAIYGAGDAKKIKAFVVDFDHDGNIQSFDVIDSNDGLLNTSKNAQQSMDNHRMTAINILDKFDLQMEAPKGLIVDKRTGQAQMSAALFNALTMEIAKALRSVQSQR